MEVHLYCQTLRRNKPTITYHSQWGVRDNDRHNSEPSKLANSSHSRSGVLRPAAWATSTISKLLLRSSGAHHQKRPVSPTELPHTDQRTPPLRSRFPICSPPLPLTTHRCGQKRSGRKDEVPRKSNFAEPLRYGHNAKAFRPGMLCIDTAKTCRALHRDLKNAEPRSPRIERPP